MVAAAALQQPAGVHPPPSRSLGAAISVAAQEVIDLCDAHQSLSAARSVSLGEGEAGTGLEGVDRLAAAAASLKEAIGVLRRYGEGGDEGTVIPAATADEVAAEATGAGQQALAAVRDLADLLGSEVCTDDDDDDAGVLAVSFY